MICPVLEHSRAAFTLGTGAAAAAGHHAVVLCHQRAYNQRLKD